MVSAPLTEKTINLVDAEVLCEVKPGAVLINVGRGPVVNERAMIDAVKDGRLRGLALDVFDKEPLPKDHELWQLQDVLLSPHNMDQTKTFMLEASELFVNELLPQFLDGVPAHQIKNQCDKEAGY